MFEEQMALRLYAEPETEAKEVWRTLPQTAREELTRRLAGVIVRAVRQSVPTTNTKGAADEPTEQRDQR